MAEVAGPSFDPCAYPELFAIMGGQVPDLRGLFLRGHGGNSAALGVQQGDAIRNITAHFCCTVQGSGDGAFRALTFGGAYMGGNETGGHIYFDASDVVPTAEESRPVNQAVRYLIRARR